MGERVTMIAFILVAATVYILPALIAVGRKHHNTNAIFALNALLGWTLIGWVGALIWALSNPPQTSRH